jgi:zinc protease
MPQSTAQANLRTDAPSFGQTEGGGPEVSSFTLGNGLEVVVIPDHRVPVATHMVWYRNGSADDPQGQSGIAHFLEHLMFKGTSAIRPASSRRWCRALGGQENAFTSYDYTAYFQRVAREHLGTMMEFEADRMENLLIDEAVVAPERDVVWRSAACGSRPTRRPSSRGHGRPRSSCTTPTARRSSAGCTRSRGSDREHALDYYRRFYTPENAILVVAAT